MLSDCYLVRAILCIKDIVEMNRHLTLLRRINDPLCPLCGEEEDTSYLFAVPSLRNDVNSLEGIS